MDFESACSEARRVAFSFNDPLIVGHYDADGLSSTAIVVSAFLSASRKFRRLGIKKLDDVAIERLLDEREIIFVDLGGGNARVNELHDVVIIDHHQTAGIEKLQINPHLFGMDGGTELSASGTAYSVFKNDVELAVVGAMGDMQFPLVGKNREIMLSGVEQGKVKIENDLAFYGRYSRPLIQFLEYSDEPYIPGISYKEGKAASLIDSLGISAKQGTTWRKYCDLSDNEKKKLISALAEILAERGRIGSADELIGESYVFPARKMDETYEANEFSTVLNACGRHGRDDVGIGVALGQESYAEQARSLLQLHRKMLREGIEFANKSTQDLGRFFLLDGRGIIDEGIIGVVCGMITEQKWKKPILGIATSDKKGWLKLSARGRNVDLASAMKVAGQAAGGIGGGHAMAAGAEIPAAGLDSFLLSFGDNVEEGKKSKEKV